MRWRRLQTEDTAPEPRARKPFGAQAPPLSCVSGKRVKNQGGTVLSAPLEFRGRCLFFCGLSKRNVPAVPGFQMIKLFYKETVYEDSLQ